MNKYLIASIIAAMSTPFGDALKQTAANLKAFDNIISQISIDEIRPLLPAIAAILKCAQNINVTLEEKLKMVKYVEFEDIKPKQLK